MRGWIGIQSPVRNLAAAFETIAELAFVHLLQCPPNSGDALLARAVRGKRHLLLLQSVHSRQAPDALLVERHGRAARRAAFAHRQRRFQLAFEQGAEAPDAGGVFVRHRCYRSGHGRSA